jgi:CheY-like chemotaxis protein
VRAGYEVVRVPLRDGHATGEYEDFLTGFVTEKGEALELLRNQPPVQVAISDVGMPEMQGMELVREVARLSPQTASVLMTGLSGDLADVP